MHEQYREREYVNLIGERQKLSSKRAPPTPRQYSTLRMGVYAGHYNMNPALDCLGKQLLTEVNAFLNIWHLANVPK